MTKSKPRKNNCRVSLQLISRLSSIPKRHYFTRWVNSVTANKLPNTEINIRIVGEKESALLNKNYRGKNKPTNVLSFPFEVPPEIISPLLGDLVICAPVIAKEAKAQEKPILAHWAHMVIHGTLHLLGYDHEKKKDAAVMEKIEIQLLKKLGYANPY